MQLLVFGAFAIVLSLPDSGPPWATLTSPFWTWVIVSAHLLLPAMVGVISTGLVRRKLEREPAWLAGAQRRLGQGNLVIRVVLVASFAASVFLTDWVRLVHRWPGVDRIWGLDDIILLSFFCVALLLAWWALYPADRAVRRVAIELQLWSATPARPVWRLGQYLSFMFRQHVLIIAVPMLPIVIAYDFSTRYARRIIELTGIFWAHEAVVVIVAGVVFLFAPVMLCHIWSTRPLPASELRDRLEAFCRRVGLRYRRILVWETEGMVVNAAVMGLFKPLRYILLSDGLLEMMDDQKIEAVFGHEAGHVKHRHIEFFLLFAILSMLIVGGVIELVMWATRRWPEMVAMSRMELQDYLQVAAMGLIVLVWGFGFGLVSRRFEWQADLYGAQSITPDAEGCHQPCFVHGTAVTPPPEPGQPSTLVCATSAAQFGDALYRIAMLNGIPTEARSWRHSSIANRVRLLREYANDPTVSGQLNKAVLIIKAMLFVGTLIGLGIAAWLYWPW